MDDMGKLMLASILCLFGMIALAMVCETVKDVAKTQQQSAP